MRELNAEELPLVTGSGSNNNGSEEDSENNYGGVKELGSCSDLIDVYKALVAAATDLIERVALASK